MGWDILGTSYKTVYSWDVPLRCFLWRYIWGDTLLTAAVEQYWEPYLRVTVGSHDGYNDD